MPAKFSDRDIEVLLNEEKILPIDYYSRIQLRDKRGHKERELELRGINGNFFRIILRQSEYNHLDFSVILTLREKESTAIFRIRRYNGKSHEHTNKIEAVSFYDFHIHMATERYQDIGMREDAFAEATHRFSDFHSAFNCLIEDCNIKLPHSQQNSLFTEV